MQKAKDILGDDAHVTSFAGPLKSKSKKKDVVAWLSSVIEALERQNNEPGSAASEDPRAEERVLLWKCIRVFVENDGQLAGTPNVDSAIRSILMPSTDDSQPFVPSVPTKTQPEDTIARQTVVHNIKQALLRGEREKAVWLATDNRLWSHAMLISSTLNKDVWRQVVQEFVRQDVRSSDQPNHSLAALYEVFAGDWEDSIDQLVPASARSGFQMVSTADRGSQPRDATEGLNKWRETIGLILSNRSAEDEKALLAMGKLLANYGRIEAAHICFIFARYVAKFAGVDDPQADFTLLGFDQTSTDTVVGLDSILLTEVYEFGLTLSASTAATGLPHLQAYKLRHAYALAELGQQTEALAYCDIIAASMSSKTRISPYYHAALISQLDDLQKRLSQSPKDGSSSWIKTKPTMSKFSSGMGTLFSKFVEGEDDNASSGSGYDSGAEAGPFTRNLGGTPSISRSASTTDFFSADFARAQVPSQPTQPYQLSAPTNSRYAPPSAYGARPSFESESIYSSSPEQRQGLYSPRMGSDSPSNQYGSPPSTSYSQSRHQPSGLSQLQNYQSEPRQSSQQSYVPTMDTTSEEADGSALQNSYQSAPPTSVLPNEPSGTDGDVFGAYSSHSPAVNGYMPTANGSAPAFGGYPSYGQGSEPAEQKPSSYDPVANDVPTHQSAEPHSYGYQPQTSSYDPNSGYNPSGGYEPSSYEPSHPSPGSPDPQQKPKKKIYGDDDGDDDLVARASALKISKKSANDRAADDAFRAAAEADAARDKSGQRATSGWFKGISLNPFGKKEGAPPVPTVHKAKLGESNSFYFDKEAGRWVNKAAGATTPEASAPTPPPPKSGPPMGSASSSRAASGAGPPPMGGPPSSSLPLGLIPEGAAPPSRTGTPGSTGSGDLPPLANTGLGLQTGRITSDPGSTSMPPAAGPSGLAPPSRPSTGMSSVSNASSLDDLIVPRKGGTVKKAKKGGANRYVDVMAK